MPEQNGPLQIMAPFAGRAVNVRDVPDDVFAAGILGPGLALWPHAEGQIAVHAPVGGTIASWHPHACAIDADGVGVLLHLGLDTVHLQGEGFTWFVGKGDAVTAGQHIATWDAIRTRAYLPVTPIVIMDGAEIELAASGEVEQADLLYTVLR